MTEFDNIAPGDAFVDESDFEIVGVESCFGCDFMVGAQETSSIIDDNILCFDMDSDIDDDLTFDV